MDHEARDLVAFHGLFGAAAALALWVPAPVPSGLRIAGLVVAYNVALPWAARAWGYPAWWVLWTFLLPLSVCQVLPDFFLARALGTLVFPADGGPRIGPVSASMAGLWVIPLFLTVRGAERVASTLGRPAAAYPAAAVIGLAIFAASEATLWAIPLWHARGVWTVAHVAVYVLPAEALLGPATVYAFRQVAARPWPARAMAAVPVSLTYLGALCAGYLVLAGR